MSDAFQIPQNLMIDRAQMQREATASESAGNLQRQLQVAEGSDLREVAEQFESLFLKQMLDTMRNTLNEENRLVDTGMAGDIFEDMLYEEYSKIMAKRGSFGIAELIVNQFEEAP